MFLDMFFGLPSMETVPYDHLIERERLHYLIAHLSTLDSHGDEQLAAVVEFLQTLAAQRRRGGTVVSTDDLSKRTDLPLLPVEFKTEKGTDSRHLRNALQY